MDANDGAKVRRVKRKLMGLFARDVECEPHDPRWSVTPNGDAEHGT